MHAPHIIYSYLGFFIFYRKTLYILKMHTYRAHPIYIPCIILFFLSSLKTKLYCNSLSMSFLDILFPIPRIHCSTLLHLAKVYTSKTSEHIIPYITNTEQK